MKDTFSESELRPRVDLAFEQQAAQQRGGPPVAPPCDSGTLHAPHVPLSPIFEDLARRSAPGHAASSELTYTWRR